jgi:hypothetical protein
VRVRFARSVQSPLSELRSILSKTIQLDPLIAEDAGLGGPAAPSSTCATMRSVFGLEWDDFQRDARLFANRPAISTFFHGQSPKRQFFLQPNLQVKGGNFRAPCCLTRFRATN